MRNAFAFSAENSSSTPAQNSKSDLLLNCILISLLDVKSMKIFSSAVESRYDLFWNGFLTHSQLALKLSSGGSKLYDWKVDRKYWKSEKHWIKVKLFKYFH